MLHREKGRRGIGRLFSIAGMAAAMAGAGAASADITTIPTTDTSALRDALNATGLTITSVVIHNGLEGQFGTYQNFRIPPVTIHNGIVLSSGNVAQIGPFPEAHDPNYDPASPPPPVNNQMYPDEISGGTAEFDDYGRHGGHIENFNASYDVASLEVTFFLEEDSAVKFDFIFGSVEYPFWTSQFTDAFLVFLDGLDRNNQVTFDANGNAVQVGSSFAGLETTADQNTAFSDPHGLIHHLTTTTERLESGFHTLRFEVGDVNDHILDSVAFIANLRAEDGPEGTEPSDDQTPECPGDVDGDEYVGLSDIAGVISAWGETSPPASVLTDVDGSGDIGLGDIALIIMHWGDHC